MNKSNVTYLFYGYGTEYSLHSLASYMMLKGFNVLEIDMLACEDGVKRILNLKGADIVFITSWHLFFDNKNFNKNVQTDVLSPLEIISYLKPIYSVYYPHDLGCQMHPSELKYMDAFDLVLLAYKDNNYYWLRAEGINVEVVGWIKKTKHITYCEDNQKIVFFPSIEILSNPQLLFTLDSRVYIKLFAWKNTDDLKKELLNKGYKVFNESLSLFDVMGEAKAIIGQASSSIIYESAYSGFPTIAISEEQKLKGLLNCPWLYYSNFSKINSLISDIYTGEFMLCKGKDNLKPFDFNYIENKLIVK